MSGHGHESHGGHGGHGGGHGPEGAGFSELMFPISLMSVVTKDGLGDFIKGMTDMAWDSGLGAAHSSPDALGHLFGVAGGGGHGGHGGHGHGGGHH